ncbi:YdcF family protein [Candidatus Parcubacteria bacterium]|nr:YdcF family protein [Candidatus Parcubacteria bacterium]
MRYCLPLSKSSWLEGRVGPPKYQDCFRLVKNSIDLLNAGKVDTILLLSEFKSKQSTKSELEYIAGVCEKFNVDKDKLHIEEYGYDTLSQIKFTLDLCSKNKDDLLILSSATHYPRVRWIAYRENKKLKVNVAHKIAWGIPRPRDAVFDIVLIFAYPVVDLLGYSERFTNHMKIRRDKGYLA